MSIHLRQLKERLSRAHIVEKKKRVDGNNRLFRANTLLLLTLLFVSVWYVVHVNALATKGYEIKELERQIVLSQKEQENLQMKSIEAGSLSSIQARISKFGMAPSDHLVYLKQSQAVATIR